MQPNERAAVSLSVFAFARVRSASVLVSLSLHCLLLGVRYRVQDTIFAFLDWARQSVFSVLQSTRHNFASSTTFVLCVPAPFQPWLHQRHTSQALMPSCLLVLVLQFVVLSSQSLHFSSF